MKKFVLVSVSAVFAVALTLNVSLSTNHKTGQTSLLQISATNHAEAECIVSCCNNWGRCSITGYCFADPVANQCDPGF